MRTFVAIAASLALVAAAAPEEPLRLEWSAHDGCPSPDSYWTAIVARSARLRRASPGEKAHLARVHIAKKGAASIASIVIDDGEPRTVQSKTCEDAVAALSLMTVLALDPDALTSPAPSASPSPSTNATIESPLPEAAISPPVLVSAELVATVDRPPPTPPAIERAWRWSLAVDGGAQAVGPVVPDLSLGIDVQHVRLGSAFRLSFSRSVVAEARHSRGAGASLTWTMARAHACHPLIAGGSLLLHTCGELQAGVVVAVPDSVINARTGVGPWIAPFLLGLLEWRPTKAVSLEVSAGLGAPLFRDEFYVGEGDVIYRAPAIVGRAGVGAKVRFP